MRPLRSVLRSGDLSQADRQPALTRWRTSAAIAGAKATSATASPASGRGPWPRPIYALKAGPGRLDPLRHDEDRPHGAPPDGLRSGAELLVAVLPALLARRRHEQLPARPRRGLRGVARRATRSLVQHPQASLSRTAKPTILPAPALWPAGRTARSLWRGRAPPARAHRCPVRRNDRIGRPWNCGTPSVYGMARSCHGNRAGDRSGPHRFGAPRNGFLEEWEVQHE